MAVATRETPTMDVLKAAWPPFKDNLGLTFGVPALLIIVPMLLVGVPMGILAFVIFGAAALSQKTPNFIALLPLIFVGSIAFAVVYNLIRVGWTRIQLAIAAGEPTSIGVLQKSMPWFWNFLLVNMIIGIATAVGGMMLVAPGVFVAVRTSLAPYLVVDKNLGPIEAIMESNELVTGYSWQVLLYYVLFTVANCVASFIPLIGAILPIPVMGYFDVALAKIYVMRRMSAVGGGAGAVLPPGAAP